MFRFESPMYIQWIWLVALLGVTAIVLLKFRLKKIVKAFGQKLSPFLTTSVSSEKRYLKLILQGLVLVAMILALARPQMGEGRQEIKSRGVELIVAVDVSQSMRSEDVRPNRLAVAKHEISRLLDRLHGDKVGLIAFAGSAAVISPLTADYSAIRMFLESLDTESVSTQGTNFSAVIKEAAGAFKRGGVGDEEGTQIAKVLLVITDGEDHEPGAIKLAQDQASKGMRIITFGVGTRKGGPIPLRDERGNLSGYLKDKSGQTIITAANEEALQELARAGHGGFYFASSGGSEVDEIKKEIDRMEKTEFDSDFATVYNDRYQVFLLLSLGLALIEALIRERRKTGRIWKGRFEVDKS